MKLPYRNISTDTKTKPEILRDFNPDFKMFLPGTRYQKNDICFKKGEVGCGSYIYSLALNKNVFTDLKNKNKDKILVLKNTEEVKAFASRYTKSQKYTFGGKENIIFEVQKEKLMKDFAGIEINNYFKIKKELTLKERKKNAWFSTLDITCFFNSIWNKNVIKEIKYYGKYKN